jgi:hypothetical protein
MNIDSPTAATTAPLSRHTVKRMLMAFTPPLAPLRLLCAYALRRYAGSRGFEAIPLSKPLRLMALHLGHEVIRLRNGLELLVCTKEHMSAVRPSRA